MTMLKESYLGDGLYASFDGFMIKLRAPREDGDHWVGLEPGVVIELLKYIKRQQKGKPDELEPTSTV